ncbi:MAG: ankyrin repeat domain-containing protein [Candidatus Endonucleobacter bathymodioli]|uniref:Ankyrin repeat domain-containing protein n=1 Tax=Candidatus Endonucleibacter bathymodioli TaxID=539814 RepID=A0AA90NTV8_9GAMM|nr:ankyrin repeat domain-containing protein [Candidatus Endonucleobacter bathymodioli]
MTASIDNIFEEFLTAITFNVAEFYQLWEQTSQDDITRIVQLHSHKDCKGSTLLHTACRRQQIDIIKLFLASGADINKAEIGSYRNTPLIISVESMNIKIIKERRRY